MSKTTSAEIERIVVRENTVDMFEARRKTEQFATEWLSEHGTIDNRSEFYRSDEYYHDVLPELRRLAGYEDNGSGRYERMTQVDVEDIGASGKSSSSHVLSELSKQFISTVSE